MILRVYFIDNNGKTDFIEYNINTKKHEYVTKVEIYGDISKIRDIRVFSNAETLKTNNSSKTNPKNYEIFDLDKHDTDTELYLTSALCSNCNNTTQIAIKKGDKLQSKKLYTVACPRCTLLKTLCFAKWNGHEYKVIKK